VNRDLIHPELLPALDKLPALDVSKRIVRFVGRFGPRLRRTPKVRGVSIRWERADNLKLRIYTPDASNAGAALLWVHGGGLVIGTAAQDDALCSTTAANLGIVVVSVEYRLAPESPFPAALDDAGTAWRWLQSNATALGIDPGRVAVGGESAGAGIAAGLAQRLHDEDGEHLPVAQWLFAPMLDDRTAARADLDAVAHPVWNNRDNRFGWSSYLAQQPGLADVPPYAVPARRTDLGGLPSTWLYTGDIELFNDEIVEYAGRLRDSGVAVDFTVVPGAVHGFENWAGATQVARDLVGAAQDWLGRALARPATERTGNPQA